MNMEHKTEMWEIERADAVIVGGGPAGLAAAVRLYENGITDILILEREKQLGGILRQCIHDGFGLARFKTTLSGPEYAQKFIDLANEKKIRYLTDATVLEISEDKVITAATPDGLKQWKAKAVILAMGCRERTRGALGIPGERPTGVFTAGVAQAYMNLYNRMPAKEVVILGSGDIGMIMARRLTLEGAHVKAVFEIQPYPSGLPRNIEQCLNDYNIPLYLSHTVTEIHGDKRLTGVTVSKVDEHMRPIPGTEEEYSCDTLILSVGLIPENELSLDAGVTLDTRTKGATVDEYFQTDRPGIFAAGNVLHVHDLVDYVSEEAAMAGQAAAEYVKELAEREKYAGKTDTETSALGDGEEVPMSEGHQSLVRLSAENGVRYTVPQYLDPKHMKDQIIVRFRVDNVYKNRSISVYYDGVRIQTRKKRVMAPGEMEQVILKKDSFGDYPDLKKITICTEEA